MSYDTPRISRKTTSSRTSGTGILYIYFFSIDQRFCMRYLISFPFGFLAFCTEASAKRSFQTLMRNAVCNRETPTCA